MDCRLKYLADIFVIKICAYAIMSNHDHVVLYVEDKVAENWSEEEIIHRWSAIMIKKQVLSLSILPPF